MILSTKTAGGLHFVANDVRSPQDRKDIRRAADGGRWTVGVGSSGQWAVVRRQG